MEYHPPPGHSSPDFKTTPTQDSSSLVTRKPRASRLDRHFNFIAACMLKRSQACEALKKSSKNKKESKKEKSKKMTLDAICIDIKRTFGTQVSKSALSRFINKHPLLKHL